jgi:hypothetical protein
MGRAAMQFQNTPQFLVKTFKRHYHKARDVADILAASTGSFSFSYSFSKDKMQSKVETPDDDATIRFIVLMRRFLDPASILFYMHIWETLKEHFPEAIPVEYPLQLEQLIHNVNKGPFTIVDNQKTVTAENIYHIVANGEYFRKSDEEAEEFLQNIAQIPIKGHLMLHEFHTYNLAIFKVTSILFDIILGIEHSEQYSSLFQEEIASDKRCIYCLSDTGTFTSEEHIVPESLGNYDTVLPKGAVCDTCNNEVLSRLDEALLDSDLVGFLRTWFMPYTKAGKLPQAEYQNLSMKKVRPNHIVFTDKTRKKAITTEPIDESGFTRVSMTMRGRKKFDPIILARAVYKMGLGMVAFHEGKQSACNRKYDRARAFIRGEQDFPNNLLISNNIQPHPQIISRVDYGLGGTCCLINIYGLLFIFNLEETPVIEVTEEQLKVTNFSLYPLHAN